MDHNLIEFLNVATLKESLKDLSKELNKDKAQRSLRNRLRSIHHDTKYVGRIHGILSEEMGEHIPLIANERCGTWYVNPYAHEEEGEGSHCTATTYFKSTDGHTNEWSFSFKRLNFHLLDILSNHHTHGAMIVDSTRRGKTVPDALSKTIPIWCATLNYFMFGPAPAPAATDNDRINGKNWFFYPERVLSLNEASKIADLIPRFAKELQDLNIISIDTIRTQLHGKHLKPYWIHPQVKQAPLPSYPYDDHIPLILCCSSERCQDGVKSMIDGWVYVQGAADDEELWSLGLTYKEFWANFAEFLGCESDEEVTQLIRGIKLSGPVASTAGVEDVIEITPTLKIGKIVKDLTQHDIQGYDNVIVLSKEFKAPGQDKDSNCETIVQHYPIQCNKKGSNDLRKYLTTLHYRPSQNTLIVDESGKDLSIGIVLVLLSKHFDLEWNLIEDNEQAGVTVNKTTIKQHLAKINGKKVVNPSRATLQSINTFLM